MTQVTAALYADTNTGAAISALTEAFDVSFQDQRNELGSFSISLPSTSTDVALCTYGRIIRIAVGGVERFAGIIDSRERDRVSVADEGMEVTVISGSGLLVELEEAKTRPKPAAASLAPGAIADISPPVDDRPMEWYGFDFDRSSGWVAATVRGPHGETSSIYPGLPGGMRVLGAQWIWSADAAGPEDDFLFFYEYVFLYEGGYVLDFAAYDAACYINGRRHSRNAAYGEKERVEFSVLNSGYILLCFEADLRDINFDEGLLWQITEGQDGPLIYASGTGMKVYSTPDAVLNMTAGDILLALKSDHAALSGWTFDFTGSLDSDGNSLSTTVAVGARIGDDSLFDVLKALSEVYIDFDVSVSGKTLEIWEKGTRDTASTLDLIAGYSTAASTGFVNVEELTWDTVRAEFNALMVRYDAGWFERPAVLPAKPRWGSLSIQHVQSGATAIQFADATLAALGVDQETAKLTLVGNLPSDQLPYVAFDKWSLLDVPTEEDLDVTTPMPVDAITCSGDDDGLLEVALDLGSPVKEWQERVEKWIARSTRGGLTGLVQMAQGLYEAKIDRAPPLNHTDVVIFDAANASSGDSKSRTMPVKGLVNKLVAQVDDPTGGTTSVTVTINGVATVLSGTTGAGFAVLDFDEGLNITVDPRTVATFTGTTIGHANVVIVAGISEVR